MRSPLNKRAATLKSQPDLPFVPPLWRRWDAETARDWIFIVMMSTGWLAGNALAVLGCVVAAFIVVAHGDFNVFMAHVDNIASRYVGASTERRESFEHQVVVTLAVISGVLLLIRLPRFLMRLRVELSQENECGN
jgi:hypothetical protein